MHLIKANLRIILLRLRLIISVVEKNIHTHIYIYIEQRSYDSFVHFPYLQGAMKWSNDTNRLLSLLNKIIQCENTSMNLLSTQ